MSVISVAQMFLVVKLGALKKKTRSVFADRLCQAAKQGTHHTLKSSLSRRGVLRLGPFRPRDYDLIFGVIMGVDVVMRSGLRPADIDLRVRDPKTPKK